MDKISFIAGIGNLLQEKADIFRAVQMLSDIKGSGFKCHNLFLQFLHK